MYVCMYVCIVAAAGREFFPLVLETLGYWTPSSLKTLKIIALKTTTCNTTSVSQAFQYLTEQLSVKLWLFNARLVHGCMQLHFSSGCLWDLLT